MCGIVGYVGPNVDGKALDVVLEGLARLEYRGYDSAGVALVTGDHVSTEKRAGKLVNLTEALASHPLPESSTGIGHTRWATHGGPTDENAHPHRGGQDGKLALIHNGIIENFHALKSGLLAVHADQPGVVVGARRNSPLVVGLGQGENFLGSDVAAFIGYTRSALELEQDQIVTITPESATVINFDGTPAQGKQFEVTWDAAAAEKGGYPNFMAKEINEQPHAVADTLLGRTDETGRLVLDELRISEDDLRAVDKIVIIACGTAAYAGMVAKYAIEHWCRIPCEVELAHEFRYRDPVVNERTLVVAISQSGETMDTLMAVKHARELGAKVVAVCNTHGSTIPRESDAVLYTHAGPEIAVASTKAFLAQITACYILGLYLAQLRGGTYADEAQAVMKELHEVPAKIRTVLDGMDRVREIARFMVDSPAVLFLGRHVGFPVALEGALKLKELAYIHAEGFAAGELKHGPIALIEPGQPVFVIVPSPRRSVEMHKKVVSSIEEIRARGARVIAIAEEGVAAVLPVADEVLRIPLAGPLFEPLLAVVPLHIFAMGLATAKGLDVDQPRNLAKSVTVE